MLDRNDAEPGLYVQTGDGTKALTLAQPTARVFRWLAETVRAARQRLVISPVRPDVCRPCTCLDDHVTLSFALDPMACWEACSAGRQDGTHDALHVAVAVARWDPAKLPDLVEKGEIFGSKDLSGGTARIQYRRGDGDDHLTVISLANGRAVDFYVGCAGSCRDDYEAFVEAQRKRTSAPSWRLAARHTEHYVLPVESEDEPERTIIKLSAIESIAQALDVLVRFYFQPR